MLQMKIKTGRRSVVPGDLPSILGARRAYREIGDLIEVLIAQMDMLAGDCDLEDDDPAGSNVTDEAHDQDSILFPIYGVDQSEGPLNYQHSWESYEAANAFNSCLEAEDVRGTRYWWDRLAAIGAFEPARHASLVPGYDA